MSQKSIGNGNPFLLNMKKRNFILNEAGCLDRNGLGENLNAKESCRRFVKENLWKGILCVWLGRTMVKMKGS